MGITLTEQRLTGGPCGIRNVPDNEAKRSPRLVIGIGCSPLAMRVAARFRSEGWEVAITGTGEEARRLAVRGRASVLVLPVTAGSLLATAKLVTALPRRTQVILVGPEGDADLERASLFLGAATFVAETGGVDSLVEAVGRVR